MFTVYNGAGRAGPDPSVALVGGREGGGDGEALAVGAFAPQALSKTESLKTSLDESSNRLACTSAPGAAQGSIRSPFGPSVKAM